MLTLLERFDEEPSCFCLIAFRWLVFVVPFQSDHDEASVTVNTLKVTADRSAQWKQSILPNR